MKPGTRRALMRARREATDSASFYFLLMIVGNHFMAPEKTIFNAASSALIVGLLVGAFKFWGPRFGDKSDPRQRQGAHEREWSLF